jgi:hypothetical protein
MPVLINLVLPTNNSRKPSQNSITNPPPDISSRHFLLQPPAKLDQTPDQNQSDFRRGRESSGLTITQIKKANSMSWEGKWRLQSLASYFPIYLKGAEVL